MKTHHQPIQHSPNTLARKINFPLAVTFAIQAVAIILFFVGLCIIESSVDNGPSNTSIIGIQWFHFAFYLFLFILFTVCILKYTILTYRLALLVLSAIAFVFVTYDLDFAVRFTSNSGAALSITGLVLMSIMLFIWILALGSEEYSVINYAFNKIPLPTRDSQLIAAPSTYLPTSNNQPLTSGSSTVNNSRTNLAALGDASSVPPGTSPQAAPMSIINGTRSSTNTFTNTSNVYPPIAYPSSAGHLSMPSTSVPLVSAFQDDSATHPRTQSPNTTAASTSLEHVSSPTQNNNTPPPSPKHARALFGYTANPQDPKELSFSKGDFFTVLDTSGKWWQAQVERNGTKISGIVPSNYMELV